MAGLSDCELETELVPVEVESAPPRVTAAIVRLTDSSLRALASAGSTSLTIRGDKGELLIGSKKKVGELEKFTFVISDMSRDLGSGGRMEIIGGAKEELEESDGEEEALGTARV